MESRLSGSAIATPSNCGNGKSNWPCFTLFCVPMLPDCSGPVHPAQFPANGLLTIVVRLVIAASAPGLFAQKGVGGFVVGSAGAHAAPVGRSLSGIWLRF